MIAAGALMVIDVETSPMSMLRTSVSAASAYDPDGWLDTPEANYRKAIRLIATAPTLIAMYHRLREGKDVVDPSPTLSHAGNFLFMLLGEEELALASLERAFEAGDPYAVHMNRMVVYDVFRDDPRFQAMLAEMNLWP